MDPNFEVLPPPRQPPPPYLPPGPKTSPQGILGWLIAAGVALFNFKLYIVAALKTGLSMLVMIWAYSWLFGWPFAVGLVLLIFVHEMGHVIAAKWLGIPVSAPLFIPFIGAAITMKENPRDAWTEALMAYGGPLAGCVGSWVCYLAGIQMESTLLIAVASVSFLLNVFNMIPVPPLDGGRICSAVSPWFWLIGLFLLLASVVIFHAWNSIFIIIIVLVAALPRLKQTLFQPPTEEMRRYYAIHISNRLIMAMLYLGLIAVLMFGYWETNGHLQYLMQDATPGTGPAAF